MGRSPLTSSDYFLHAFLTSKYLSLNDVVPTPVPPSKRAAAHNPPDRWQWRSEIDGDSRQLSHLLQGLREELLRLCVQVVEFGLLAT